MNRKKRIELGFICMLLVWAAMVPAQEQILSLKGGLSVGAQSWNGSDRSARYGTQAALQIEWAGAWNEKEKSGILTRSSLVLQAGYHEKGSAIRTRYTSRLRPTEVQRLTLENVFNQLSVVAAGKFTYAKAESPWQLYYMLGLRVDYLLDYDILLLNYDNYINRFTWGVTLAGGVNYAPTKKNYALFVELGIAPDLGRQVFVPEGIPAQYRDESGRIQTYNTQEQKVINTTFELALGARYRLSAPTTASLPVD